MWILMYTREDDTNSVIFSPSYDENNIEDGVHPFCTLEKLFFPMQ